MEWLNIRVPMLRSPEYVGSDPAERAAWLNVLAYCAEQENGGRMAGCGAWKDRQWQQTCGVTLREVRRATRLLAWSGGDLIVWGYPQEKQAEVMAKREAGRRGGVKSGEARREPERSSASSLASSRSNNVASTEGEGEGEGERKGKEGEGAPPPGFSDQEDDFAHIPTTAEVIAHGALSMIPRDYCENYHAKTTEGHHWLSHGRLIRWRHQIVRWWARDQSSWSRSSVSSSRAAASQPHRITAADRIPNPEAENFSMQTLAAEARQRIADEARLNGPPEMQEESL